MMKHKYLTIIGFIFFIALPTINYKWNIIKVDIVDEKRQKASLIQNTLLELYKKPSTYIQIEKYYNDNFPLRDLFLRLNGQFEYSIFGRSKEVIVGDNGWLSDKKLSTVQIAALDKLSDQDIEKAIIKLKKLQTYCNDQGIYFMLVIIPVKPTVYAKKFPEKLTKREYPIMLEKFQNTLQENDIPYIDALNILRSISLQYDVFYKTDMHFNTIGSTYIAKEIVNHLSRHYMNKDLWDVKTNKGVIKNFNGNESSSLPLIYTVNEDAPAWNAEKTNFTQYMYTSNKKVKEYEAYRTTSKDEELFPPMMMFGNSFMLTYPSVGLLNYFSQSYRVLDYEYFRSVLDYIEPKNKIFILHVYETQLLFHIMDEKSNYWDKRIDALPLPDKFIYKVKNK
ncbi:alginate O-acetyltransferase AlgX-related protein [Sulfurospirillum sp.]|uniref:alginate O-acetyltransferase AlgX-related protein n=1 Tax=Sulfurospirillum sp. TaxID=2053622 RepID=UPI002FDEE981